MALGEHQSFCHTLVSPHQKQPAVFVLTLATEQNTALQESRCPSTPSAAFLLAHLLPTWGLVLCEASSSPRPWKTRLPWHLTCAICFFSYDSFPFFPYSFRFEPILCLLQQIHSLKGMTVSYTWGDIFSFIQPKTLPRVI